MLKRIVKQWRNKLIAKCYRVDFYAHEEFDLDACLSSLPKKYKLKVIEGRGTRKRSVTITLPYEALRKIIADIPQHVLVAYEEKEPEKC